MKVQSKYLGVLIGLWLALAGFFPLMAQNGISVNGFHPELGLYAGYWLLGIGPLLAALGFWPGRAGKIIGLLLALLAMLLAFNMAWQGHKMQALAWGGWLLLAAALVALGWQVYRLAGSRE